MFGRCWKIRKITEHDDVIKWKHIPRYWPFVWGIHRSPVNSPHKGQWRGALVFSVICAWINGWTNTCEAGDLRRYRAHYDVTLMQRKLAWEPHPWSVTWLKNTAVILEQNNFPKISIMSSLTVCEITPAWISNYIHYEMWGEITYPLPNLNGATVEVWEWISNFIQHVTGHVITYPCWN